MHRSRYARPRRDSAPVQSFDAEALDPVIVELSDAFARAPASGASSLIDTWLARLAPLAGVDRITLWELSADGEMAFRQHFYARAGAMPPPPTTSRMQFTWLLQQSLSRQIIKWSRMPEEIPESAVCERQYARQTGAKSLLSIPVSTDSVLCIVAFVSLRTPCNWPPALVNRLRLAAGVLAGAVGRERAAAGLIATEAKNRALLAALPDPMLVVSRSGVYLEVHCRDETELLLPREQLIGLRLDDVLPAEVAGAFHASLATLVQPGDTRQFEYTLAIKGERREYEARMVLREDDAVVCIIRNISERNLAVRRLRESEERFRGAFEHSGIGIALVALDGRWLKTNPALTRILGYTECELQSINFQVLTHPDDLEPDMQLVQQAVRGEVDHFELEKRYRHKDGRTIPAFLTVSVVRDEERRPLYFVSQVQDLSDREKAQMENERLRIELNHFGRLALIGQLTASLAHEVTQPIAAARANAAACQRLIEPTNASTAEIQEGLEDIVRNCIRAGDVVNQVRGLLRKELKPRKPVDLNRLVREVTGVTRHELLLRKVQLVLKLQPQLPSIVGNSIELQQVILNLLLNGADAVQRSKKARVVILESLEHQQHVELAVHDSGTGAVPAALARMFEPFFTTKPEGMGMGLTICADIVRSHGGRICPELNDTGGLTMRCLFPRASA